MATRIKFKRSETPGSVPDYTDLEVGEVALNTADQKLYARGNDTVNEDGNIPNIYEVANKGQTTDEVTSTTTVMSIALS
jgi:hypothetical protein